jgi:hypothetical protein
MTFVILTTKPGQYRTEAGEGIEPVERYDYSLGGRTRAQFVIARLEGSPRVKVVDETPPPVVNYVPCKFLPRFESIESARRELQQLASAGGGSGSQLTAVAL